MHETAATNKSLPDRHSSKGTQPAPFDSVSDLNQAGGEHHVVIIGAGFGGLFAAKSLRKSPVRVTLIDRRNHHLFQPLLYQVATGGLSPADIASPVRGVLANQKNVTCLHSEVTAIDLQNQTITADNRAISYDSLIVATGSGHAYFGNDDWAKVAPGLKSIEDAIEIRNRIFAAFEAAEKEDDPELRRKLLTFVIIGGGPTGVELAGALCEIANETLRGDFRRINSADARILLVEFSPVLLRGYPEKLSQAARKSLEKLGATVMTGYRASDLSRDGVMITSADNNDTQYIESSTILWAAGVRASRLGKMLVGDGSDLLDKQGRVMVEADLSIHGHPNVFVIGDLANYSHQGDESLPGVAPVAMAEGKYVARLITDRLKGKDRGPFRYSNPGMLATIGRASAVADFGRHLRFSGYFAWLLWLFIHLMKLVEFDNRLQVFVQWVWNYITRNRGARLITFDTQNFRPD